MHPSRIIEYFEELSFNSRTYVVSNSERCPGPNHIHEHLNNRRSRIDLQSEALGVPCTQWTRRSVSVSPSKLADVFGWSIDSGCP